MVCDYLETLGSAFKKYRKKELKLTLDQLQHLEVLQLSKTSISEFEHGLKPTTTSTYKTITKYITNLYNGLSEDEAVKKFIEEYTPVKKMHNPIKDDNTKIEELSWDTLAEAFISINFAEDVVIKNGSAFYRYSKQKGFQITSPQKFIYERTLEESWNPLIRFDLKGPFTIAEKNHNEQIEYVKDISKYMQLTLTTPSNHLCVRKREVSSEWEIEVYSAVDYCIKNNLAVVGTR